MFEVIDLNTDDEIEAARTLLGTLSSGIPATESAIKGVSSYRDAVRGVREQNLSRTITIAAARLVAALDDALKVLESHKSGNEVLVRLLNDRIPARARF